MQSGWVVGYGATDLPSPTKLAAAAEMELLPQKFTYTRPTTEAHQVGAPGA